MNSSLKLILVLALLAGLATVTYILLNSDGDPDYAPEVDPTIETTQPPAVDPGIQKGQALDPQPERQPVTPEPNRAGTLVVFPIR